MSSFTNPGDVATYAERVARHVPGLRDLHRMVGLLLAERAPADASILVLGAGGGLELRALAEAQPGWRFDGVDPAPLMLDQARATLGDLVSRVTFHEGYVDDAPEGSFDGATCLLTLHFLKVGERRRTLEEMHRRLKPGAPLVTVHHSFPNDEAGEDKWLRRNAALIGSSRMTQPQIENNLQVMKESCRLFHPSKTSRSYGRRGFQTSSYSTRPSRSKAGWRTGDDASVGPCRLGCSGDRGVGNGRGEQVDIERALSVRQASINLHSWIKGVRGQSWAGGGPDELVHPQ